MKKSIYFIALVLCCLFFISCSVSNVSEEDSSPAIWMKDIDDSVPLFSLNIPGTHDTCALYDFFMTYSTAKTQDLTLLQQLNAGVRYIDIRAFREKDGSYTIHHGIVYQHMSFDDVLDICYGFLKENPSEVIIFGIKNEEGKDEDLDEFTAYIESKINENPEYWIPEEQSKNLNISLGDSRGKMFLVKRYDSKNDSDYGIYENWENEYKTFRFYEYYKIRDLEGAWNGRKQALDYACEITIDGDSEGLRGFTWISGYFEGFAGFPNILKVSNYMNPRLIDYINSLDETRDYHLGIIVCDHITREISEKIYLLNF